jgi:hypothetical protein
MKCGRAGKCLLTFGEILYLMYKDFIFGGKYLGNAWEVRLLNSTKKEKFFRSNKEKNLTNFGECAKI